MAEDGQDVELRPGAEAWQSSEALLEPERLPGRSAAGERVEPAGGLDAEFDRAARRYDLLTGLNPGYHRHLAAAAQQLAGRVGPRPGLLLDLGCGSGSSTGALQAAAPQARIVGVDASDGMLRLARGRQWRTEVDFHHATAQQLPELGLPPVDGVLAAYLLRNVPEAERDVVLAAVHDQLRPGGWLAVQEYSVAGRPRARLLWSVVSWAIVIPLSWLLRGSPRLYRYLWRSVLDFDSVEVVLERLRRAGFTDLSHLDVTGWQRGILHTFLARRPDAPEGAGGTAG